MTKTNKRIKNKKRKEYSKKRKEYSKKRKEYRKIRRIKKRKSTKKKKARGKEEEVPFILKKFIEKTKPEHYEPAIIQNIMSSVPRQSITKAIAMDDYKKWHKARKEQLRIEKQASEKKMQQAAKRKIELRAQLDKIEFDRLNGPARRTRGQKDSKWNKDYEKFQEEYWQQDRIINSESYKLNRLNKRYSD